MKFDFVSIIRIRHFMPALLFGHVFGFSAAHGQAAADADFLPPPERIQEPDRTLAVVPAAWNGIAPNGQRPAVYPAADEVIEACRSKTISPDPNGTIWISFGKAEVAPVFQNPFDARLSSRRALVETVVRFSGVVNGPNPVAILNGKAVVQGDRWLGFNITAIARNVILLEKNGAYASLPRGREVTIRETY